MLTLLKGVQVYYVPTCLPQYILPVKSLVVSSFLTGTYLMIPVPALAVCSGMYKGLGRGEGFDWEWIPTACLPEYVEPVAVFPLRALGTYHVRRQPGPPDETVCGPHQSDGDPTIDVSTCP